jgi:hypothetical protein
MEQLIDQQPISEINSQLQCHKTNQAKEPDKTHNSEQEGNVEILARVSQLVKCIIEVMMAEVKLLTSKGIEGEIFCLEAMRP